MKKATDKNIIKFSKIFVLSCFSFLAIFSFSEAGEFFREETNLGFSQNNGTQSSIEFKEDIVSGNTLRSYDVYVDTTATSTFNMQVIPYPYFPVASNATCTGGIANTASIWHCILVTPYVIQNNSQNLIFQEISGFTPEFYGDSSTSCLGLAGATGCSVGYGTNGHFPYIVLYDTEEPEPDPTDTRIVSITPLNNATTTSTTQTFEVEYYINSSTHGDIKQLHLEWYLKNSIIIPDAQETSIEIEPIIFDQIITATTTFNINNNQVYNWKAVLNAGISDPACASGGLAVTFCIFNNLMNRIIATTETRIFTIGTDPRTSVTDFGNSLFNATGADSNLLGGGCAFVATSTCDIGSPSTYGGCFTNSVIVAFCPSVNTISYATTTLMNSFYNKMPFGFFVQPYIKIAELTNATSTTVGSDVVVNIPSFGVASTTIFSWSEAKDFMDGVIGETVVNTLMIIELVGLTFYCFYRLIGSNKKKEE